MRKLLTLVISLLVMVGAAAQTPKTTIFLIGDSTCATKKLDKQNPERGWGQMFPNFFDNGVEVSNHAVNGRSTKSFRNEGRWQAVEEQLTEGDYVFIQFAHNDEKINDTTRYSSPEQYGENVRRYIRETRAKGATPVVLTPVVRRKWEGGVLNGRHGGYTDFAKKVAEEESVTLIDMEQLTWEWINAEGDEPSKLNFMWVEKGVCPLYPDGRQDDTHFNIVGARKVAAMVAQEVQRLIPELSDKVVFLDLVVAKDGSGDFMSVQEAIDALPEMSKTPLTLYIRDGIYREKVVIPASKQNLLIRGESEEGTVISWDDYASKKNQFGKELGTSGSATMYVQGTNIIMSRLTIENTAGRVGQAVALMTMGDKQVYINCRLLGNQDTLYTYGRGNRDGRETVENWRNYFLSCYIEGTTDFIFGSATAYFDKCKIHCKADSYITAASTCEGQPYGYVFELCEITAEPDVTKVYLGRPWRNYAQTVFINTGINGDFIRPEGWHNWNKAEAEKTVVYGEYYTYNPHMVIKGSYREHDLSKRVKWAKRISKADVESKYSLERVVAGGDKWNPNDLIAIYFKK